MTPATIFSLDDALRLGPPPEGNLAIPVFSHGAMEAEFYVPVGEDLQRPHTRDEIYFVADGFGNFFNGETTVAVKRGTFIFVPAGVEHRFVDFSEDFKAWVIFCGPEGG